MYAKLVCSGNDRSYRRIKCKNMKKLRGINHNKINGMKCLWDKTLYIDRGRPFRAVRPSFEPRSFEPDYNCHLVSKAPRGICQLNDCSNNPTRGLTVLYHFNTIVKSFIESFLFKQGQGSTGRHCWFEDPWVGYNFYHFLLCIYSS